MPWLRAALIALPVLGLLAAACGGDDGDPPAATDEVPQAPADAPNVVVILTDDQTLESMRVMTRTNDLLAAQGTTFTQNIVSFPLCCPSRATFLTGQYAHNHGVLDNLPPEGGYDALDNRNTLPVWLQRAGYATSHVGHYLYTYGERDPAEIPPGWDSWFATIDPSTFHYFDYEVNVDGEFRQFGTRAVDYQTDVLADRAVSEIDRLAAENAPFFLDFWTLAPHVENPDENLGGLTQLTAEAAPRHRGLMEAESWPRTPSFNEEDMSDKPGYLSQRGPFSPLTVLQLQNHYQESLESLLAVDEAVERITTALDEAGVLDETVILFTSDNGFLQGEHRIRDVKELPYEEAIRVPLIVRGGGFPAGATVEEPVSNIDLAPTILDLAGVGGSREPDGEPLLPIALDPDSAAGRAIYIQNGPQDSPSIPPWEGVRVDGYTYVEYQTGVEELYDLAADPFQLDNVAGDPAYEELQAHLADLLEELRRCEGDDCREPSFTPPN